METWTTIFWIGVGLFTIWQTWRGWKLGVIRASLRLGALVGSGLVAWYGGKWAGQLVGLIAPAIAWPVALGVGISLLFVVYLSLILVSALLFKRTDHQSSGLARWLFGAGGAVVGLLTAGVFLWAAVSGIRAFGAIEEARQAPNQKSLLSGLRAQLEGGGTGEVVRSVDPIPDSLYGMLGKFSRVTADPAALQRLIKYPGMAPLLEHPRLLALADNPEVQEAALRSDYFALLRHPALWQAATDPDLVQKILQVDFVAALDFALENPSPSPAAP
jgi:hypothetical protein